MMIPDTLPETLKPPKQTMKTIITSILLLCSALTVSADSPPAVGQKLPSFSKLLPKSTVPSTKGKVVLVDFWASWCAPCRASFPCFSRLHKKYASKGLVIVAIGVDEDASKYKAFAAKHRAAFPLVHDASHKAAAYFRPSTMPTSYLVDRNGVIRHIHKGFRGAKTEALYEKEITALLSQ